MKRQDYVPDRSLMIAMYSRDNGDVVRIGKKDECMEVLEIHATT